MIITERTEKNNRDDDLNPRTNNNAIVPKESTNTTESAVPEVHIYATRMRNGRGVSDFRSIGALYSDNWG